MTRVLHLTSFLFGTVVVHAYHARHALYHHLTLLTLALSVAAHTARHRDPPVALQHAVDLADRVVAHLIFAVVVLHEAAAGHWLMLLAPACSGLVWLCEVVLADKNPPLQHDLHALLHVGSVAGFHLLLWNTAHTAYKGAP